MHFHLLFMKPLDILDILVLYAICGNCSMVAGRNCHELPEILTARLQLP